MIALGGAFPNHCGFLPHFLDLEIIGFRNDTIVVSLTGRQFQVFSFDFTGFVNFRQHRKHQADEKHKQRQQNYFVIITFEKIHSSFPFTDSVQV